MVQSPAPGEQNEFTAMLRQGQFWEYNQIIRLDRELVQLQHLTKRKKKNHLQ